MPSIVASIVQRDLCMERFSDRREAGARLARAVEGVASLSDLVVIGLPRGGVPVAYEIARRLEAPLDVLIVRKIGVPGHAELAMGAIASGGIRIVDRRIMAAIGASQADYDVVARAEQLELDRRERLFRDDRPVIDLTGKNVILVDDGLATGSTMLAAIDAVRSKRPRSVLVAVPIAPPETCDRLSGRADRTVCLVTPERMTAVGAWYEDFTQTTDDEVRALLLESRRMR